jgi:membrane protein DedA with SNARE-associated domain
MDIPSLIQHYGYLAVAAGAFLEGEAILVMAGAAAYRGYLMLPTVIIVGAIASFLGNQLYFSMGRRYGPMLLQRFPSLQCRTRRVTALLDKYHLPLILALQFLYGLRIAGALAIGMSEVRWHRFLLLNFIGAIGWAALVAGGGYGLGRSFSYLKGEFSADTGWMLGAVVLAAMLGWAYSRRRTGKVENCRE